MSFSRIRAHRNMSRMGIELYAVTATPGANADVAYLQGLIWTEPQSPYALAPPSPLVMDEEQAQELIDDLYHAGFRPKDMAPQGEVVQAVQAHLTDVSGIAAKLLDHLLED